VIDLQLYEGRSLDIVTQAETVQLHRGLRTDIDRFGRAGILLEIVDQVGLEDEGNPALFKLLTGALAELDREGNPLVVPAFAAKVLALEGVQPMLEECVRCGATDRLVTIQIHEGGVLCQNCRQGEPVSDAARRALVMIFAGRVRHVLETTEPETAAELEHLASRMMEQHLERRLRTSALLHGQIHPGPIS
jgi:DNA repair protein RecO (recombination protein O)